MKGRKPTREERKVIKNAGLDTYSWLVQKNTLNEMFVINVDGKEEKIIKKNQ